MPRAERLTWRETAAEMLLFAVTTSRVMCPVEPGEASEPQRPERGPQSLLPGVSIGLHRRSRGIDLLDVLIETGIAQVVPTLVILDFASASGQRMAI